MSQEIDAWLRSLDVAPGTRNSMLRCIKVLFSFARGRDYLPADRATNADAVRLVKSVSEDVSVFAPARMEAILACEGRVVLDANAENGSFRFTQPSP